VVYWTLTNLIKNAIEASISGDTVRIEIAREKEEFMIRVANPAAIPLDQQLQMFQRSFSTKGSGRGIGTYSIKLLTEKFLKGKVSFSSSLEAGTCFEIRIPFCLTR
jgi:sensor histidine kinase regulating citrate/malate metabolism